MHSQPPHRRCCQWLFLACMSVVLVGCAPTPEAADGEGPALVSNSAELKSSTTLSRTARPDAYARSNYREKGLGIRANKPAPSDDSDTPEDANKYDLNPPRESDQQGLASWYGEQFHGRKTASGERFDSSDFTAAHRSLPFGSRVCVRSSVTGKSVIVRINDRGPFAPGRVIDLSKAAAQELGMLGLGIKPVELWQLDEDEDECPTRLTASGKKRHPSAVAGAAAAKVRSASASKPARKVSQTARRGH
ncbi:septal ring lytic transglycosylase RlpA family protein [Comamonas sp. w2-DMI]|uniref:Endolytic peptidoglycan transglycosylase RlpA n=1 Tax=Comamonas terrae TaxID=673548 RepID=A0ABW5UFV2_9BURK|nr:septal ring lytic transglycosylase RlpA family protein [Comamonas terrae]